MKWSLLKQNRCPDCGAGLRWNKRSFFCESRCGFAIRQARMNEIVQDMVADDIDRSDALDNLEELSALELQG